MENASKALIMAGSILVAMMIVGALVFGYHNLSELEQTRSDSEKLEKTSNYLSKFEAFDKGTLYGSEILSLANLREEYEKVCSEQEGYSKVTIWINIKTEMQNEDMSHTYITKGNKNIIDLAKDIRKNFEDKIADYEKTEWENTKKTIKDFSSKSYHEIADLLKIEYAGSDTEYEIEEKIRASSTKNRNLLDTIAKYKNLKSTYTQFKNTKFERKKIELDALGRIKTMEFEEQEIPI